MSGIALPETAPVTMRPTIAAAMRGLERQPAFRRPGRAALIAERSEQDGAEGGRRRSWKTRGNRTASDRVRDR